MAKRGGGFPRMGGGGMGNMQNLMQQAQKMQQQVQEKQSEIEQREFSAASGGGMVSVRMTGKREMLEVKIDPSVVDPEDVEMLEDLTLAAVNQCLKEIERTLEDELGRLTGGLNIGL